jgi:hypothetical protein
VQPLEQAVEHDEAGLALEDAVEAGAQFGTPARRGIALVGLEVGVEPPVWTAPWMQGRFGRDGAAVGCGHVSGLDVRCA